MRKGREAEGEASQVLQDGLHAGWRMDSLWRHVDFMLAAGFRGKQFVTLSLLSAT